MKASRVETLDELNEAFRAWARRYNDRVHGETDQAPLQRWRAASDSVRFADEEVLRQAFLFADTRKADKAGVFSLHGTKFQVGPELANRRFEVRYDPEELVEVEVFRNGHFVQRLQPFVVATHRRPKPAPTDEATTDVPDGFDLLAHWVDQDREEKPEEPDPADWRRAEKQRRDARTEALLEVLREHLDADALDEPAVRIWLAQHGPFEVDAFTTALAGVLQSLPRDLHATVLLEQVREVLR